jgi:hypothetical protein
MDIKNVIRVELGEGDGYNIYLKLAGDNYALATCNENFVIQKVHELKESNGTFVKGEEYGSVPPAYRTMSLDLRANAKILNALLLNGFWERQ